jgi:hypothetical protein
VSARLSEGPFHVKILSAEKQKDAAVQAAAGNANKSLPSWVANLSSTSTTTVKLTNESQFRIEGIMR